MKALSVLVADDQEAIRVLVKQWLQRAGHTVACASDGREAEKLLAKQKFDLVITDVVMPDVDGLDVIAAFRKVQPGARVVAISGGGRYLEGTDCLKIAKGLGAHASLIKPFTWEKLLAAMHEAMRAPDAPAR